MTDLKKINYYVFLTMGIGSFLFGAWVTYIMIFQVEEINRSYRLRGVFGPVLAVIGLYVIYQTRKHGKDIARVHLGREED